MIELLCLFFLSRRIGENAAEKRYEPAPYKRKLILFWFVGELIASIAHRFLYQLHLQDAGGSYIQ